MYGQLLGGRPCAASLLMKRSDDELGEIRLAGAFGSFISRGRPRLG
jgi:hypothetical protein